jgi:methylated-DNA-protein-cysteine methyltransferase-like protein
MHPSSNTTSPFCFRKSPSFFLFVPFVLRIDSLSRDITPFQEFPLAPARQSILVWLLAALSRGSKLGVKGMTWDPVYTLVKQIPRARVLSYGDVANALKLRGGARSAGRAMAACPSGRGIPWHRVVGADGKLLIREPYASLQRKLLESEGVQATEQRVNMKLHRWAIPPATVRKKSKKKSAKVTKARQGKRKAHPKRPDRSQ